MTIAILMSTYNGSIYIRKQIQSIIDQSYKDWILLIRDDGSIDNTLEIIRDFCASDVRIQLVYDKISHRGCRDSFLWLLKNYDSDIYFFCDQDDIWESNKVELSIQQLDMCNHFLPAFVCTDLKLIDKDDVIIKESMWKSNHISNIVKDFRYIQIASLFTGCTMAFNRQARDEALKNIYQENILHDQLLALSVFRANGQCFVINIPCVKYRQHGNNVIGAYIGDNLMLEKLKRIVTITKMNYRYFKLVHTFLGTSFLVFFKLKIKHILNYI